MMKNSDSEGNYPRPSLLDRNIKLSSPKIVRYKIKKIVQQQTLVANCFHDKKKKKEKEKHL